MKKENWFYMLMDFIFNIIGVIVNVSLLFDIQIKHEEPTLGRVYIALFFLITMIGIQINNNIKELKDND